MPPEWVRDYCLSLPHTTETVQWGNDLVFKIGGKMYAVLALEPSAHIMSFKCSPENFAELIERPKIIPAPYLARAQWVALEDNTALPRPELQALLQSAYQIVFSGLTKKAQKELGSLL